MVSGICAMRLMRSDSLVSGEGDWKRNLTNPNASSRMAPNFRRSSGEASGYKLMVSFSFIFRFSPLFYVRVTPDGVPIGTQIPPCAMSVMADPMVPLNVAMCFELMILFAAVVIVWACPDLSYISHRSTRNASEYRRLAVRVPITF